MPGSHKKIRCHCIHCGKEPHRRKAHDSHGENSFRNTHPGYCSKHTCNPSSSPYYKRKRIKNC
jgi:hypothetical protein